MTEEHAMLTMEARVKDLAAVSILEALLKFDGQKRRQLFRDYHIRKKPQNDLKREYTQFMTARHFNSLHATVKASVSALKELRKTHVATQTLKIKSAEAWIAEKSARLAQVSAQIADVLSYRAAKRASAPTDKRRKMPAKLRRLSLGALTEERRRLKSTLHHKTRYTIAAKRRLDALRQRETLSLCFGSKKLFRAQFHLADNGYENHAEWRADFAFARSACATFLGSKDETAGNQTAQYDLATKTLRLRLPKTAEFHGQEHLTVRDLTFPEKYLPHLQAAQSPPVAGSKKTDKVQSAVQVKIVKRRKRGGKETAFYVQISCRPASPKICTSLGLGAVGIDLNADHLAIGETDRFGNLIRAESLPFNLTGCSQDQADALLGDYVAAVVGFAKAAGKPLVMEALDFQAKKAKLREEGVGRARMLSAFVYAKFKRLMTSRCAAQGVGLIPVNPAFSSVIGAAKFAGHAISSHEKAALVLARRALGYSERPKVFHDPRKPPARMAAEGAGGASTKAVPESRHRDRHVWSFWRRRAKSIRSSQIRGRKPKASGLFGQTFRKHPLVAKAAGVMSLAEERWVYPDRSLGSEDAARLAPLSANGSAYEQVWASC